MPHRGTCIIACQDRQAILREFHDAARHLGLKSVADLGAYVEKFVGLKFARYRTLSGPVSRVRLNSLLALLREWRRLPAGAFPTPAQTHACAQTIRLMAAKGGSAWQKRLWNFAHEHLSKVPDCRSVAWTGMEAADGGAMRWVFGSGEGQRQLTIFCDPSRMWLFLQARKGLSWQPVLAGSWCHETWLRVLDFLFLAPDNKGLTSDGHVASMQVLDDLGRKLHDRRQ